MIERYSRPEMAAIWSDENRFKLWLEIETLAMEAMADEGIVPKEATVAVRKKGAFDKDRVLEIEAKVKHDVIAFLTNVSEHVGPEARFLHLGMTSSDLLDTTFALQLAQSTDLILKGLQTLCEELKKRAFEHKNTICVGRSHGIHAEPTTFGLKLAIFYAELKRHEHRLKEARKDIAVGTISGPVGTFAHLPPSIEQKVCALLGLGVDPVANQVIQRDRHAALFSAYAQLGCTLEQMVVEVRHLQRTEVREAEEFFSKGQKGSSAMPHKRNPVLSENVTGLARLLRCWASAALENVALWHERDISHSSVERVIAPDATITLDFMLARVTSIFSKLLVYPEAMKRNLELTRGLYFSGTLLVELAKKGLTREDAYAMVQAHAMDTWADVDKGPGVGRDFKDRVLSDPEIKRVLSNEELANVFSIDRHLKHVDFIFDRVFGKA